MKHTKTAGAVIINQNGNVVVVSQQGTSWSLPKGHIEEGEDAIEAARREIYEETGLTDLEFVRELGTYQRYKIGPGGSDDRSESKIITLFLFRASSQELKPIDPSNPETRWVPKDQVAELLTHPKDKEFFLKIKDII